MFVFEIKKKAETLGRGAAVAHRQVIGYDDAGQPMYAGQTYVVADSFESACRWIDSQKDRDKITGLTQKFAVDVAPMKGTEVRA